MFNRLYHHFYHRLDRANQSAWNNFYEKLNTSSAYLEFLARVGHTGDIAFYNLCSPSEATLLRSILQQEYGVILDLGCGNGGFAQRLEPSSNRYRGIDYIEAKNVLSLSGSRSWYQQRNIALLDQKSIIGELKPKTLLAVDFLYGRNLQNRVPKLLRKLCLKQYLFIQNDLMGTTRQALGKHFRGSRGYEFDQIDLTDQFRSYLVLMKKEWHALKDAFDHEGHLSLFYIREKEFDQVEKMLDKGRLNRYLYKIQSVKSEQ